MRQRPLPVRTFGLRSGEFLPRGRLKRRSGRCDGDILGGRVSCCEGRPLHPFHDPDGFFGSAAGMAMAAAILLLWVLLPTWGAFRVFRKKDL